MEELKEQKVVQPAKVLLQRVQSEKGGRGEVTSSIFFLYFFFLPTNFYFLGENTTPAESGKKNAVATRRKVASRCRTHTDSTIDAPRAFII